MWKKIHCNIVVLLLTRNIIFSKKSLYNPDIKQNIITIKCTALTFLEIFSFSSCGGSVIQKFTFVWINSKIWDYTQANFVLGALKLVVVCSWLWTCNTSSTNLQQTNTVSSRLQSFVRLLDLFPPLGWIEDMAHLHPFSTNSEPKPDEIPMVYFGITGS